MNAIIIGAGIGGLAAAIGLRQHNIAVEIYERAPELREIGAGLTLWDNAARALAQIGAGDLLAPISAPELRGGIRTPDGALLVDFGAVSAPGDGAALSRVVHRADLQAAMLGLIDQASLHLGKDLVDLSQERAGVVARFADGSQAHGDILIGADGIGSRVRAALHGARPARYAGYTAWRAVVPFDAGRSLPGETWGLGLRFGQVPLGDGRVYWFAAQSVPAGRRIPGGERAELLRLFGGWHAPIPELIAAAEEAAILRHDIADRPPLRRWGQGRVTLLGDAAHPTTPNLGQGACQALEDAAVLARCLAEGGAPDAALRRYEALRIPRTAEVVRRSRLIGAVGQWRNPLAAAARNQLMRMASGASQRQIQQIVAYQF
ncbi:FAD-dependent monooxygenase [Oscillochloris sp. ZM17-4]|uniref:FAD-dependent monooxygenase n=1 Tax=Oscillochloris sp. ZM17-4 TaxID=2866714 RepID=UPI001C735CA3|nr:FAD-dependent monooxygenase [Oscillochloris sp. ZM17-4]MBX0331228.1 FAD-dependent monooxygenase [Oscillochloris sp. ZM17-4]